MALMKIVEIYNYIIYKLCITRENSKKGSNFSTDQQIYW